MYNRFSTGFHDIYLTKKTIYLISAKLLAFYLAILKVRFVAACLPLVQRACL